MDDLAIAEGTTDGGFRYSAVFVPAEQFAICFSLTTPALYFTPANPRVQYPAGLVHGITALVVGSHAQSVPAVEVFSATKIVFMHFNLFLPKRLPAKVACFLYHRHQHHLHMEGRTSNKQTRTPPVDVDMA